MSSIARAAELLRRPGTWAYAATLALLVASIPAYQLIPGWASPWGLDLQNVWAFHHCRVRDDPYGVPGAVCGDLAGRPMPYPPLLYWSFSWVRAVSFPAARWIWATFCLAVLLGSAVAWACARDEEAPPGRPIVTAQVAVFGALLATQFPAVFAIERGNNDTLVLLVWTCASMLFLRGRRALAGLLAGAAAILKIYPAFAVVVVAAGALGILLRGARAERLAAIRFMLALAVAPVAVTLALIRQTRIYVDVVLPPFAAHLPAVTVHSHSVPATLPEPRLWSGAVVSAWMGAAFLRMREAPRDVLAGALAISTFVAATSFDYNLVTTFPLLMVQLHRALTSKERAVASWLLLGLGLVSIIAHRGIFSSFRVARVASQVTWLVASAALVVLQGSPRASRSATA